MSDERHDPWDQLFETVIISMTTTTTKTPVRRACVLSALAVLAAMVLTSCTTSGTPVSERTGESSGSSSQSASGGNALHDLDPCTLLTSAEVQRLGAQQGQRRDTSKLRRCSWILAGSSSFDIAIYEDQAAKDVGGTKGHAFDVTIGRRHGRRVEEGKGYSGLCVVTLDVGENSSVSTAVSAGTETAKACDVAKQVATLFEPKLP